MCLHLVCTLNFRFSEHEILREEIKSLQAVRAKLQQRVQELEEEVKVSKEEAEKAAKKEKSDGEEEEVPMAQRKRFTRVEMARVLMVLGVFVTSFLGTTSAVDTGQFGYCLLYFPMSSLLTER